MQKPDKVWLQKSDKTVTTTAWATAWPPGCHPHCPVPSGPGPWEAGVALQIPPWRAGHSLLGAGGSVGQGMSAPCRFCSSSQEYQSAQASLTRSFQGKFDKFVVPCVVASGDTKDRKGTEPLSFRCSALGSGVGWSLSLPTATQIPVGPAQGLDGRAGHMVPALPSANPRHSQSPQHAVPGAVVSSSGAVYRGDVRQRQDHH